jgi:hypothetical protein
MKLLPGLKKHELVNVCWKANIQHTKGYSERNW